MIPFFASKKYVALCAFFCSGNAARFLPGISLFFLLSACHTLVNVSTFNDPDNTYNAATTYQKLVGEYPFIHIASRDVPDCVQEIKNITYVQYGNRSMQLDLYFPTAIFCASPIKKKVGIIFVHGGGWRAGYRENFTPMAIRMAERGYVAATISYRLSPEAPYPAAIFDVKAAIRWMRSNAEKYDIDPQKIAVSGGSAGGQIASLVGVTNGMEKFDPQGKFDPVSSAAQAIINIDGLSDFTSEAARFYEDDPTKKPSSAGAWFGGRYEEKKDRWHEASPTFYVRKETPPILFIGSAQTRFSVGRSEMIEKMQMLSVPSRVFLLPDTPHSFWLFDPWLTPTVNATAAFLEEYFH